MDIFPQLYTRRLHLRKITAEDIASLVKYANNKKISDYVLNIPHPYSEPDAVFRISYVLQGFKARVRYVFSIVLREEDDMEEFIGEIGLHLHGSDKEAQLGYWVAEPFWNRGIASEAIAAVLKFGFEKLELEKIFATCHAHNLASGKVLVKNGLVNSDTNGDIIQYRMTRQQYNSAQHSG